MKTFHFEISSDGRSTLERVDAADDNAASRQALLLMAEILRDRGLSARTDAKVVIAVRDALENLIWEGSASGRSGDVVDHQTPERG